MALFQYFWRLFPLFIVLLGFVFASINLFASLDAVLLRNMPYFLGAVVLLFAAMFNRSRFIAPVVIALLTYLFIREKLQVPLNQDDVLALFTGLNVLFCAQLVISGLAPEKGMFTPVGFVSIGLLVLGTVLLWLYGNEVFWVSMFSDLLTQRSLEIGEHYWATDIVLLAHLAAVTTLALLALVRRSVSDYALLITWLSGALIFFDFGTAQVSSICFSALLVALLIVYQKSNYQVTYMDALTGIPGRRALEDYLDTLSRNYAVAMLDVDHFKKFNDTYGHDVGDQVLKMVASKIAQVEGGGRAFRYGGEEFTVVFNRRNADHAFVFLEAVRESIRRYEMTLRSDEREDSKKEGKKQRGKTAASAKKVSVTISIGVANSAQGLAPKDVIKLADENLYRAKEAGRNCTICPD